MKQPTFLHPYLMISLVFAILGLALGIWGLYAYWQSMRLVSGGLIAGGLIFIMVAVFWAIGGFLSLRSLLDDTQWLVAKVILGADLALCFLLGIAMFFQTGILGNVLGLIVLLMASGTLLFVAVYTIIRWRYITTQ